MISKLRHDIDYIVENSIKKVLPDENSFNAMQRALKMVENLSKEDTVVFLLSGGGSALFELPLILGNELQDITKQLLASGAAVSISTANKSIAIASIGSDGTDGPTDAAGGYVDNDADNFAKNFLIPPSALKKISPTKYTSDDEIISFAKTIGIHPEIVAGRLQHEKILPPNRCSKSIEQYHM